MTNQLRSRSWISNCSNSRDNRFICRSDELKSWVVLCNGFNVDKITSLNEKRDINFNCFNKIFWKNLHWESCMILLKSWSFELSLTLASKNNWKINENFFSCRYNEEINMLNITKNWMELYIMHHCNVCCTINNEIKKMWFTGSTICLKKCTCIERDADRSYLVPINNSWNKTCSAYITKWSCNITKLCRERDFLHTKIYIRFQDRESIDKARNFASEIAYS